MKEKMRSIKKYLWIVPVLIAILLAAAWGVNEIRNREWEQLQSEINISAEEAVEAFEEAGLKFETVDDITGNVSKPLFGEPNPALLCKLTLGNEYYIKVYEYPDWKEAKHTVDYQTDFCECNLIDYKGGLFSHGAVVIIITPPDETLEAQLKQILMDRHNLMKKETQTK